MTDHLHGKHFFELFRAHWPMFWPERDTKKWNQEDRFKSYLQRNRVVDTHGNLIITELANPGATATEEVDYVLLPGSFTGSKPPISSVLATCEFKGPARTTVWKFTKNWFGDALLPDIKKQYRRASLYGGVEHYFACVALLDNLSRKTSIQRQMEPSIQSLSSEVTRNLGLPASSLSLVSSCRFDQIDSDMIMFLWRITDAV